MKPFSPLYFIKANKMKCALLIFMIFLGYAAYLGGLYVTNPEDNWSTAIEYENGYMVVGVNKTDKYEDYLKKVEESGKAEIIRLGSTNGIPWKTVMKFKSGNCGFTFTTVDDFKKYCKHTGIDCDFTKLKSNTAVLSRMLAANRGIKVGDIINNDTDEGILLGNEFEVAALTEENGYFSYYITEEGQYSGIALLMTKNTVKEDLAQTVFSLNKDNSVFVLMPVETQVAEQFELMYIIYIFIIIMLSVIMAVTVNAAFVGTYQRRTYEFAVYRAIGISKKRMIGKLLGELLIMDAIALIGGGAVFFLLLFLFNNLVLAPAGMYLCYYSSLSLIGLVICNITIMIPLIITRSRQMLKADICEF